MWIWAHVVRTVGGFHEAGPVALVIHDRGAYIARRRVIKIKVGR